MTFLKKAALFIIQAGAIVAGVGPLAGPILQTFAPGAAGAVTAGIDRFQAIVDAVMQTEVIGQTVNMAGPQKAEAVAPLVAQILLDYCRVRGYKVDDDGRIKILAASKSIGGAVADVLNAIHPDSVKTLELKS